MADLAQLEAALVKADASGNAEDARVFASEIRRMRSQTPVKPFAIGKEGFKEAIKDEYGKMNWADRQLVAAGTALGNVWERGKQIAGKGDETAIEANRIIAGENPGAAIAGNIALMAPAAMVPGANTMVGSAIAGGVMGAAQPTLGDESTVANTLVGGAGGVFGKVVGDKVASAVAGRKAAQATRQGQNALKDAALKESQEAGYVVPKSEVAPSFINNRLESVAGKAALKQDATLKNQDVSNSLGRKLLGLADDQPISKKAIDDFIETKSEPYRQIAALDKRAASALDELKEVRAESKTWWKHYNTQHHPSSLKEAKALDAKAKGLESEIDQIAKSHGQDDLVKQLRDARKEIAKAFDLERATNLTTGDVSAAVLGRMLDKGKPLSEELKKIAKFAKAHPKFAGAGPSTPAAGVGKTEALASALLGMGGHAVAGPAGLTAAALPLLSGPTRSMLLSKPYQKLVKRNYGTGVVPGLAGLLAPIAPSAGAGVALETLK
jgi:hypothetical protein